MYKLIALFAAIACTSAQVLKINPLVLGSTHGADLQTINLAATGRLGGLGYGYGGAIRAPIAYGGPAVAYAAPVAPIAVAAPKIAYAAPQLGYARAAYLNPALENYGPPEPYTFGFTSSDEFGTQLGRQETSDGSGAVTGSYSLAEADGRQRIVQYVADAAGFRATVQTNEPGTANANPADVQIQSSAPSRR